MTIGECRRSDVSECNCFGGFGDESSSNSPRGRAQRSKGLHRRQQSQQAGASKHHGDRIRLQPQRLKEWTSGTATSVGEPMNGPRLSEGTLSFKRFDRRQMLADVNPTSTVFPSSRTAASRTVEPGSSYETDEGSFDRDSLGCSLSLDMQLWMDRMDYGKGRRVYERSWPAHNHRYTRSMALL